jgi:hypothetical protein
MKEGRPRTNFVARQNASVVLQQNGLFIERFPYVCPEPVLVKSSLSPFPSLCGVLKPPYQYVPRS